MKGIWSLSIEIIDIECVLGHEHWTKNNWNATFDSKLHILILKPKFDSHEASFDSQTHTSIRVSTAQPTRKTMQGAIEACHFERFPDKMRIKKETSLYDYWLCMSIYLVQSTLCRRKYHHWIQRLKIYSYNSYLFIYTAMQMIYSPVYGRLQYKACNNIANYRESF